MLTKRSDGIPLPEAGELVAMGAMLEVVEVVETIALSTMILFSP
ncbi:hypothetical protein [Pantoea sp. B65]